MTMTKKPQRPPTPIGVVITMEPDSGMIRLDFKEWGVILVPPEVAEEFVSSQRVRDSIRREVLTARGKITLPVSEFNQIHNETERLIKAV